MSSRSTMAAFDVTRVKQFIKLGAGNVVKNDTKLDGDALKSIITMIFKMAGINNMDEKDVVATASRLSDGADEVKFNSIDNLVDAIYMNYELRNNVIQHLDSF